MSLHDCRQIITNALQRRGHNKHDVLRVVRQTQHNALPRPLPALLFGLGWQQQFTLIFLHLLLCLPSLLCVVCLPVCLSACQLANYSNKSEHREALMELLLSVPADPSTTTAAATTTATATAAVAPSPVVAAADCTLHQSLQHSSSSSATATTAVPQSVTRDTANSNDSDMTDAGSVLVPVASTASPSLSVTESLTLPDGAYFWRRALPTLPSSRLCALIPPSRSSAPMVCSGYVDISI